MLKLVVLVSGGGTNLQAIMDAITVGDLDANIALVIADRECYGLERARLAKIPTKLIDRKIYKEQLSQQLLESIAEDCDLIIMAGFLSIINKSFINKFENRIINLHPSLLPKFGGVGMWGMNVHQAVITAGETKSGCTVHYVTEDVDAGQIILQSEVAVLSDDTPELLQKRILEVERKVLILAIKNILKVIHK